MLIISLRLIIYKFHFKLNINLMNMAQNLSVDVVNVDEQMQYVVLMQFGSSTNTNNKSNRDNNAAGKLIFISGVLRLSYLPNAGFAAANIDVRAFNVVISAFAILIVCCSITLCMILPFYQIHQYIYQLI
eukprot:60262_1